MTDMVVRATADLSAVAIVIAAWTDYIPKVAALFTIVYMALSIYDIVRRIRDKKGRD